MAFAVHAVVRAQLKYLGYDNTTLEELNFVVGYSFVNITGFKFSMKA